MLNFSLKQKVSLTQNTPLVRRSIDTRNFTWLLMCLPACILIFIFSYIPMVGVVLAFKEYHYDLGIFGSSWVGLENFRFFFESNDALRVTRNTILYSLLFMIGTKVFSVLTALLLYEVTSRRKIKVFQTIMLMPHFMSWVIVSYLVYAFLNQRYGFLNNVLNSFGWQDTVMVINKRYISEMRRNGFCISKAKEAEILAQFSTEPDDFHEWTEQDIYAVFCKVKV